MKFKTLSVAFVAAMALAAPTVAQNAEMVETVDGWDIMIDHGEGLGCMMNSDFDDGTALRIGSQNDGEAGYVLALNAEWDFFEEGEDYAIGLSLGGEAFEGIGTGTVIGGVPGLDIYFDGEEFAETLVAGGVLEVTIEGETLFAVDLEDASAPIMALISCEINRQG